VALDDVVPFLLEDRLRERGATVIPATAFQPQVVTSARIVTGQNPASAKGVGLAITKLLEDPAS
jgi:putative intracellular protease/amidase